MVQDSGHEEHSQDIEFSGLVLGFCSAALSYLGFGDRNAQKNIPLARQNMGILKMLQSKTAGNLNTDEEKLLGEAIKDLEKKLREVSKA